MTDLRLIAWEVGGTLPQGGSIGEIHLVRRISRLGECPIYAGRISGDEGESRKIWVRLWRSMALGLTPTVETLPGSPAIRPS